LEAIAISPDGKILASGAADNTVKLWDVSTGAELRTLSGHTGAVSAVQFSRDGQKLLSASEDQLIKVWDAATGKELMTLRGANGPMPALALSPDGKQVIAWAIHRRPPQNTELPEIQRFDLETAKAHSVSSPHERAVSCLAFSVDGELAAMGDRNGSVRLWNLAKDERVGGDIAAHKTIGDLIFTPDKKFLLTGGGQGEIKIWDLSKREAVRTVQGHKQTVTAFAMSNDGHHFATASEDQEVKLWETATGKELRHWENVPVRNMVFTPDGQHIATANLNATLYLLECPK
jgi:WD40 repeat protein